MNACRPLLHYQDSSQAARARTTQLSESVPALMSGGLHDASEETLSVDMDIEEVNNEGSDHLVLKKGQIYIHVVQQLPYCQAPKWMNKYVVSK